MKKLKNFIQKDYNGLLIVSIIVSIFALIALIRLISIDPTPFNIIIGIINILIIVSLVLPQTVTEIENLIRLGILHIKVDKMIPDTLRQFLIDNCIIDQFVTNTAKYIHTHPRYNNVIKEDIINITTGAIASFPWEQTKEGYEYWNEISRGWERYLRATTEKFISHGKNNNM